MLDMITQTYCNNMYAISLYVLYIINRRWSSTCFKLAMNIQQQSTAITFYVTHIHDNHMTEIKKKKM